MEKDKVFTTTFKKFPQPKDYSHKEKAWIIATLLWRVDTKQKLEEIEKQLNEILDSELMKQAERFMGKQVRYRWEGQLSVVKELLESLK